MENPAQGKKKTESHGAIYLQIQHNYQNQSTAQALLKDTQDKNFITTMGKNLGPEIPML